MSQGKEGGPPNPSFQAKGSPVNCASHLLAPASCAPSQPLSRLPAHAERAHASRAHQSYFLPRAVAIWSITLAQSCGWFCAGERGMASRLQKPRAEP